MGGKQGYTTETGVVVAWSGAMRAWLVSFAGREIGWAVDRDRAIIMADDFCDATGAVL